MNEDCCKYTDMLTNYLKIAFRNLAKHKLFSFINIFGLALSMSVCLMVLTRIKDQMSYDTFHPHPERTYRIITTVTNQQGAEYRLASTPLPLAASLTKEYNFIEQSVRIYPFGAKTVSSLTKELKLDVAFADPYFFRVFGFTLQSGDAHKALTAPNSLVLNEEAASKYFGKENPIGKVLSFGPYGDFLVTGVLHKAGKSHINFDAFISMSSVAALEKSGQLPAISEQWNNGTSAYTYVTVQSNTSEKQVAKAVSQIAARLMKNTTVKGKEGFSFEVQRLDKIILGEDLAYNLGNTGSREKVLTEIGISIVLLLSACFNYTNLSLARSLRRGKEVGVRKVAGAARVQVFYQFIIESVFFAFLSLGAALVLFKLLSDHAPFISEVIPADAHFDISLFSWFVGFALFTGLLAGALPAWALSSFKPVEVLKNLTNIRLFGSNGLRKTLIVIQFTLSLIIIIFTITFFKQFNYLAEGNAGYNVTNIINIPLSGADYSRLSHEIAQLEGVERVSATSANLGRSASGSVMVRQAREKDPIGMEYYDVDANFISNMGLTLTAGNTFEPAADNNEKQVIISETAQRILQFKTPADAIGQMVWLNDTTPVRIAGVLKDFFYRGLETPYGPLVLRNRAKAFNYLHVKTTTAYDNALLARIKNVWKQAAPYKPFEASWLYDDIHKRKSARGTVSMLAFLAIITITLACMGLLGMVVYNTETRKKEIGIRKVMGASVAAIITLLSKAFLKLVIIASGIALPVGYLITWFFLNLFANRINVGFGILALSFAGMLVLCLATIGSQIYKVAVSNPVKSLRTE